MAIPPQLCTSTAVVELAPDPLRASWLTCELRANYPMALEPNGKLLWVGFRLPERLAAFDTANGSIQTSAATCGDTDDLFVDDRSKRIYVIGGSGEIGVYDTSRGGAIRIGTIPTRSGARTGLLVPQLDRLYVAARATLTEPAEILIYRPTP